ncbi:ParA family protein [Endothiovibrio diazotrophicus]
MKVWTVANQKGGVGKTTTAVTLGGLMAAGGHNTLLVDLDPHGSLTSYFGYDPDNIEASVYTLFQRVGARRRLEPANTVRPTNFDNIDLMPASPALATLDRQLGAQEGMGLVLARALNELSVTYTRVLIDCPPMLGVLMVNALAACNRLVIPVQTEFLAIKGLERMVRTLTMIRRARRMNLPHTIVPTMFDEGARPAIMSLKVLREGYPPEDLWDSAIPVDSFFRDASRGGVPLPQLLPNAKGVVAYRRLWEFLEGLDDERAKRKGEAAAV